MNSRSTITFRHLVPERGIVELVRRGADKLMSQYRQVSRCRVVVDRVQGRHQKGNLLRAEVIVNLPHKQLVVKKNMAAGDDACWIKQLVTDAFHSAQRAVTAHTKRLKRHRVQKVLQKPHMLAS